MSPAEAMLPCPSGGIALRMSFRDVVCVPAVVTLALLAAACRTGDGGASSHKTWLPSDPAGAVVCPQARAERTQDMPHESWDSAIYIDRDGREGAEAVIRMRPGDTWSLTESSQPGLHDKVVASGAITEDGMLQGLPADAFSGATDVWASPGCSIGGEAVPKHGE